MLPFLPPEKVIQFWEYFGADGGHKKSAGKGEQLIQKQMFMVPIRMSSDNHWNPLKNIKIEQRRTTAPVKKSRNCSESNTGENKRYPECKENRR